MQAAAVVAEIQPLALAGLAVVVKGRHQMEAITLLQEPRILAAAVVGVEVVLQMARLAVLEL